MKITNKAGFLTIAKEGASKSIQGKELVSYDIEDTSTCQYAAGLVTQIQESAGDKFQLGDLFKWTVEDICTALTDILLPVNEGSSDIVDGTDVDNLVKRVSDDACSLFNLMKDTKDVDLLTAKLGLVSESTPAEPTEEVQPEVPVDTVVPVEEATPAEPTEEVQPEVPVDTVVPVEETTPVETTEVTPVVPVAATETLVTDTEVLETVEETAAFTIVPSTEEVDDTPWNEVDKGAIKTRLREAKESGAKGVDDAIAEVYAVVGSTEDPATWKYPHHVIRENGSIVLSKTGLASASGYLSARYKGAADTRKSGAQHLERQFKDLGGDVPSSLSRVAESAELHMVSIEVLGDDKTVHTLDNSVGDAAVGIGVAESIANVLYETGFLNVDQPTVITIDSDQLGRMKETLSGFVGALMGTPVQEAIPASVELEARLAESMGQIETLTGQLNLFKKKVDTLHSLLEGSPLEGVAESVVGAEAVTSVEALKSVAESIGVKRLITTPRMTQPQGEVNLVRESGGMDSLELLSQLVNKVRPEEKETPKPEQKRKTNLSNLV